MTTSPVLRWLERGLLAVGVVLAVWCVYVLVEMRRTASMPVPPPITVTQTLPADADNPGVRVTTAPAKGTWLARLEAPSVQMTATVLEGSDDGTLRRGAGHIEDTPLPGQPGNIGIAGHRDTNFRPLKRIHVGDPMTLTTADRVYQYRVTSTTIVSPNDVYVLDPTTTPTVTLVTCYPFEFFGHAPKRFIVHAELVGQEARTQQTGLAGEAGRAAEAGTAGHADKRR